MECSLDSVHYLYMKSNPNPSLLSHAALWVTFLSINNQKIKENKRKRKININLAVLPSYDKVQKRNINNNLV